MFVDQDEAARIHEAIDAAHRGNPGEGRQQHRIRERQFVRVQRCAFRVQLLRHDLAGFDRRDARVGDPLDVALAQFRLEQPLGIADAAQPHVPDVWFRTDEGDRHAITQLAAAQVGIDDHREFVGRPEATGALHRADHDWPGICQQPLVSGPGFLGVRTGADRLRETAFGTQTGNFVESQARTGGDDEIVVRQAPAIHELQLVFRRNHLFGGRADEMDAAPLQRPLHFQPDAFGLAPADRHPWIGGREIEPGPVADHADGMRLPHRRLDLVGRRHAAQSGPENDDVCHGQPPVVYVPRIARAVLIN